MTSRALILPLVVIVVLSTLILQLTQRGRGATERGNLHALTPSTENHETKELARTIEALDGRLRAIEARLEFLEGSERVAAPASSAVLPFVDEADGDLSVYLEQYVASFANGGEGAEFLRLAVEAYAPQLVRGIAAVARDRTANLRLRERLIEMLGKPHFQENTFVQDTLLHLIDSTEHERLARASMGAISKIADESTWQALERIATTLRWPKARGEAIVSLLKRRGDEANAAIVRMLTCARDDDVRGLLYSQLRTDDKEQAHVAFETAIAAGLQARIPAAKRIGDFHGQEFDALIGRWLERESNEKVRALLARSRNQVKQVPSYDARRAIGPADAGNPRQDSTNAWCPKGQNMGIQWLELDYDPPIQAHTARVFEVLESGYVVSLTAFDAKGREVTVWSGSDPTRSPGVFEVHFPLTRFPVARLRVHLDTNLRKGWPEIDAVELIGPGGRAWATDARASSNYGQ